MKPLVFNGQTKEADILNISLLLSVSLYLNMYMEMHNRDIIHHICPTIDYKCLLSSLWSLVKRPARDACLCMGELQAPPAPAAPAAPQAPHFVFLITL